MREDMISLPDDKRDNGTGKLYRILRETAEVKEGEYQVNMKNDTRSCYHNFIPVLNHEIRDDSRGIKQHASVLEGILVRNIYPGLRSWFYKIRHSFNKMYD